MSQNRPRSLVGEIGLYYSSVEDLIPGGVFTVPSRDVGTEGVRYSAATEQRALGSVRLGPAMTARHCS